MFNLDHSLNRPYREICQRVKKYLEEQEQYLDRHFIFYREGSLVERHLSSNSTFCKAMVSCGYLTATEMEHAAQRYRLGMTRDGAVIFWQIDLMGNVCDGKVMYYQADGHRDHHRHPTWYTAELKRCYCYPHQIATVHWLFGTHLLKECPTYGVTGGRLPKNQERLVRCHVVEAEKTAVIMSQRFPQHVWLATGGKNELTTSKLMTLRNHPISLFPDTDEHGDTYRLWYDIAKKSEPYVGHPIYVSSLLERQATPSQKRRKIDLVDFLYEVK